MMVGERSGLPPNHLFALARGRLVSPSGSGRTMSRQEVADAVNAYLWQAHRIVDNVDATYVGHLEKGRHRWPGAHRREGFRHVLRATTDAEIGFFIVRGSQRPATMTLDSDTDQNTDPVPQRIIGAWLPSSDVAEVLAYLSEEWHALVRADNLLGPRHALLGVQAQLDVLVDLLATDLGSVRAGTVQLAAKYAESAAWLHDDAGATAQARRWTGQAMEWAYETGDRMMLAWTAYRRSQQLTATGHTFDAIGLARSAQRSDDRQPGPMRAAIRVQHARGLAMTGDESQARRLLDEARTLASDDRRGDARSGHGSFCTDSYIKIQEAMCLSAVNRHRDAIAIFDHAIPALPPVYRRDRAGALVGKAAVHLAAGEPDLAANAAHAALPIARRAGSARIVQQIRTVGANLQPYRTMAPVAALLHDLRAEAA
jgi:tetratricopeptide (TPR) repeat protein